jgi:hypothetical protein
MSDILPCPNCGAEFSGEEGRKHGKGVLVYNDAPCEIVTPWPHVVCLDCGASANGIDAWNRRSEEKPTPTDESWQPIERWWPMDTAPKDGTPIVVYCPPAQGLPPMVSFCAWHEDAGFCVDELRTPALWTSDPGLVKRAKEAKETEQKPAPAYPRPPAYSVTFAGRKLDPYRIADLYSLPAPLAAALKKILRRGRSSKTEAQDLREAIASIERQLEMMEEDKQ